MTDSNQNTAGENLTTWVRSDDSRPYCTRPWRQIAVLSDGTAVCACVDAAKTNPLGDLRSQSFDEVWNGAAYKSLRRSVAENIDQVPICVGCPNRVEGPPPPKELVDAEIDKPRVLFLESYAGCNLTCPGCDREAIEGSRESLTLDLDTYKKLIDDLSPNLDYMEFHLGGENYMHKNAHEMVRYCKDKNPHCFVLSSTNGHFFHNDERCDQVIESGIDALIFSVDGATQESYEKYRVNGRFERVLDGIRRLAEAKQRAGKDKPWLIWRYILFEWNDSKEEMDLARKLAKEVGADHLTFLVNLVGSINSSKRYYIDSPHLQEIADELWDTLPNRITEGPSLDFTRYVDGR